MADVTSLVAAKMIQYFGQDIRRINHALKVFSFAGLISGFEELLAEQLTVLDIASLLHDIGIKEAEKQYQSSAGPYQELLGPDIARDLLQDLNLSENVMGRITYLIGHHHTYHKIDRLDFQILVEADFLVNIFEDQLNFDQIVSVQQKYFKTKTGIGLLMSMLH